MTEEIHVLHLIDGLELGGAEGLVFELTSRLAVGGYRVTVGYCEGGTLVDRLNSLGIKTTKLNWRSRFDPRLFFNMIDLIKSDPPQIVHTHLFKSDFYGRLAARLCRVPIVITTLHNCDAWANNPVLGLTYGLTTLFANKIIAVAEEVKEFAIKRFFMSKKQIITIRNAIKVDRFLFNPTARKTIREEFHIPLDVPLFGIIARLDPQKDYENFLQAAFLIKKEVPSARFLIVGDGKLRASLVELADKLNLNDSVIFCGMRKDIPSIMSAIDVFVLSSLYEGLPVVLLEAMAASRPIVSTAVNGVPGVVVDGETGMLVPPSNSASLAKACITLATNQELRKKMGELGLKRVKSLYDIEVMTNSVKNLYNELLKQSGVM